VQPIAKFQIASTKSQINSKFEISMTESDYSESSETLFLFRSPQADWSLDIICDLGFAVLEK